MKASPGQAMTTEAMHDGELDGFASLSHMQVTTKNIQVLYADAVTFHNKVSTQGETD